MFVERSVDGTLEHGPEKVVMPALGDRIAALFTSETGRSGLYLASSNAGFQSSLRFWSEACRSGVGRANPELFPWTLANAPCGWLARQFGVTGPNATYTGKLEALASAFDQAAAHLTTGEVSTAIIVAVDFAQRQRQSTRFAGVRLSNRDGSILVERVKSGVFTRQGRRTNASTALAAALDALQKCPSVVLSDGYSTWVLKSRRSE